MTDHTALVAELREAARHGPYSGGGYVYVEVAPDSAAAAADAIEQLTTDLDARFEHSDHQSAKYFQRMRAAEKELRERKLHHFEEEQKSARLEAVIREAATVEDRVHQDTAFYVIVGKMRGLLEAAIETTNHTDGSGS